MKDSLLEDNTRSVGRNAKVHYQVQKSPQFDLTLTFL
jgi:hypothetical protein